MNLLFVQIPRVSQRATPVLIKVSDPFTGTADQSICLLALLMLPKLYFCWNCFINEIECMNVLNSLDVWGSK